MRLLLAALTIGMVIGCSHRLQMRDWSTYTGPGAEHFQKEEIDALDFSDPVEPFNRSMWAVNHALLIGLADPASSLYRMIVPKSVRDGVRRFGTNLLYPRRLVANLLQGKFKEVGDETKRFCINTTIGILGIFDPATRKGIEASTEDFGQTFAALGWRRSTFLMLPLLGPSSVRDGLGLIPDSALNPATYLFPAGPILSFNTLSDVVPTYKQMSRTSYDPYEVVRVFWTLSRDNELADYEYTPESGPAVETLKAVFLTYQDPDFASEMRQHSVSLAGGRRFPYSCRMQPAAAPMVFIVPGIGAHRAGSNSLGLAEMVYQRGFSVVTISSSFNWEFMEFASSTALPGHTPVDARDVHVALDAIYHDLTEKYPRRITARVLMGYSLGAFHALYIAAAEQRPDNDLIGFDRYVTIAAPVQLLTGMQALDTFYNAPMVLPKEQRPAWINSTLRKVIDLTYGKLKPDMKMPFSQDQLDPMELPFNQIEAKFLIGLSFRLTLLSAIDSSQKRNDMGVLQTKRGWLRRSSAYDEIFDYSYTEYFYAFVLPYYQRRDPRITSWQRLLELNDLRSIGPELRQNDKIRHFASRNDFLVADGDIEWLVDVLGQDRVRFFPTGGHLGNLYRPHVQGQVMAALADLLPQLPASNQ